MADVLSVGVNLEAFAQAISAIQALRSSVSRVFDCLKDGMRNKETLEGREKAFIAHFQDNLHSVNRDLNELERLSNLVGKPSENHPLHNSGLLSLDPVQDKTPLYSQLLQAYKWSNKVRGTLAFSGLIGFVRFAQSFVLSAAALIALPQLLVLQGFVVVIFKFELLKHNLAPHGFRTVEMVSGLGHHSSAHPLLRPLLACGRDAMETSDFPSWTFAACGLPSSCHGDVLGGLVECKSLCQDLKDCRKISQLTAIRYVDDVISRIDRMFPEMSIHLSRPNGTSAMLLVTLGKVLKVIVVMRSLFIDRTIVKGYNENVYAEDGKLDIWSKSNYQVFQKVTDHATTALLHYQLPQMPDVVVRSFMTWLRSYIKLFQAPCQRCGKFLQDGLPPTWRDFRTLEAFHDTCRQ
ncbi:hypothetical protein EI555_017734 [Monodon monoceros]|uniref:Mediator of RNA polymerase II transcription subunit 27 n=1 Tax=Monodon monoceros TaxID=40151 RepID=A0A4U1FAB3_MONMO|nr:hypothetical protein EI555_017734 [Monodon monoceros]